MSPNYCEMVISGPLSELCLVSACEIVAISRHSFYIGSWVKCLKKFRLWKRLPMQFKANILSGIERLFFVWFWCSFFFRFLIKLSFSSMSTDLTTESSIYLAINMAFLFWGQLWARWAITGASSWFCVLFSVFTLLKVSFKFTSVSTCSPISSTNLTI